MYVWITKEDLCYSGMYTTRSAYYMALNFCWLKTFVVFKSITFWNFFEVLRMVTSVFIMMWKLTKLTQFVSLKHVFYKIYRKVWIWFTRRFSKVIFLTTTKSCVPVEVQNLIGMPYLFAFLVGVSTLVKVYTMSHESSFSPKVNPLKQ